MELARALVELPDETPDSDLAASHVLASWSHLGDLNLIARAVERQCRFIAAGRRPRSAKDRFRTLCQLASLEKSLLWRGDAKVPPAAAETIATIRGLTQKLADDNVTVPWVSGPESWWPDDVPLTAEGFQIVVARQTARADEENRRGPTLEEEAAHVRAIRDETRYQVASERFQRMKHRFRNGRLTGQEWETLTRLTQAGPGINKLFEEGKIPAAWEIGMRIWSDLIVVPTEHESASPWIWNALTNSTAWEWLDRSLEQELRRRELPDAVDRDLAWRVHLKYLANRRSLLQSSEGMCCPTGTFPSMN